MGHLLKIKCLDSRVNAHNLDATSVPLIGNTNDGASAKFSTNSYEADYSVVYS